MSTANDANDGAPNYDNPEDARRLREELARRQREEEQQTASALSVKERLQQKRDENTHTCEFMDEELEFRYAGAERKKRGIVLAQRFGGEDEEDLDPDVVADLVDYMTGALADLSTNDDLDKEFWGTFDFDQMEGLFEDVVAAGTSGEVTEEEVDEFLGE